MLRSRPTSADAINTCPRPRTLGMALAAWCVMLASFASREPARSAAELSGGAEGWYDDRRGSSPLAATRGAEAERAAPAPGPDYLALAAGVAEAYRAGTGLAPGGVWPALARGVDWTALRHVLDEVARGRARLAAPPPGPTIRSVYIGDLPPDDIGAIAERIREHERARRDAAAAPSPEP